MKRIALLAMSVSMLSVLTVSAQTWGCGERDFKCQLEGRMKALEADPKNPENYYNVGLVLQRSGDHKQAVAMYDMYVIIPGVKPEYLADGYNNRGISQRALKMELSPAKPEFVVNRKTARKLDATLELGT